MDFEQGFALGPFFEPDLDGLGLTKFLQGFVDGTRSCPDLFHFVAVHERALVLAPLMASRHDPGFF